MTNKDDLQQELKEKVKEGIKPSHLKGLKRSKSADDIPKAPPSPTTRINELEAENQQLKKQIKNNPPSQLLQDQLTNKQKEIESLREQLETTTQELNSLKENHYTLLDTNLTLKHQSLKDWWQQYQQTQKLEKELKENIDYASDELVEQDKVIEKLRTQNSKLQQTNQSLTKDLDLATKLAELRKDNLPDNSPQLNYLKLGLYSLLALWLVLTLLKPSQKITINQD